MTFLLPTARNSCRFSEMFFSPTITPHQASENVSISLDGLLCRDLVMDSWRRGNVSKCGCQFRCIDLFTSVGVDGILEWFHAS